MGISLMYVRSEFGTLALVLQTLTIATRKTN